MRNVRLLIAYDGSRFFGWQRQDGFASVQQSLEEALGGLCGEKLVVHGAGRTDSGVHALGQVAHAHVGTRLADDRLRHALNAHLPQGVVVRRLETCDAGFHARFASIGKRYVYWIATARFAPPFPAAYCHWVDHPLDFAAMRAAARELIGRRDFSSLANAGSPRRSNVRTLQALHFIARRERFALVVQGDGFLYNMVRTLVGTLLDVGRGKISPGELGEILAARDRSLAGATAPPGGLYLLRVLYPATVFPGPDRGPHGVPGLFQA